MTCKIEMHKMPNLPLCKFINLKASENFIRYFLNANIFVGALSWTIRMCMYVFLNVYLSDFSCRSYSLLNTQHNKVMHSVASSLVLMENMTVSGLGHHWHCESPLQSINLRKKFE